MRITSSAATAAIITAVLASGCQTVIEGSATEACDGESCRRGGLAAREAYCEARVGTSADSFHLVDVETDYLPNLLYCENQYAEGAALEAQAIAARSYLYYMLDRDGFIRNSQAGQVSSCPERGYVPDPDDEYHRAVRATSGQVLFYGSTLVCAFYHAGSTEHDESACGATDPYELAECCRGIGDSSTEKNVTYNYDRAGDDVTPAPIGGPVPENRGLMSQNGAECLERNGWDAADIIRFYYGEDTAIVRATGDCVDPARGA